MAPVEAEAVERVAGQRLAAHRLAGFGAAQLEHMLAGRSAAEIMVEADDAVDFGARQVQRSSHRSEESRGGKSVAVRVDIGGRRILKKKKHTRREEHQKEY